MFHIKRLLEKKEKRKRENGKAQYQTQPLFAHLEFIIGDAVELMQTK